MMDLHKKAIPLRNYTEKGTMHVLCIVPFFEVVPPPGPPARQALKAKARCCGIRRVSIKM